MDPTAIRSDSPVRGGEGSARGVDTTAAAATLLERAAPGDGLLVAGLVPASTLRAVLTPDASALLHDSLVRIVTAVAGGEDAVVPWIHDEVLALLPRASTEDCLDAAGTVRARWHEAWQAPVTAVTGTASVDAATPASVAVFLAGARLGAEKDRRLGAEKDRRLGAAKDRRLGAAKDAWLGA